MSEFSEDRVYERHPPVRGTVLIVGAGAVGGGVALELAYMGVTPLWVCDYKNVDIHNLVRQPHSAEDIGKNKAEALAGRIQRDFPPCNAVPIPVNFLELSRSEQLAHVRRADLVVAATDQVECQRRINEICLEAEVIAVYPGVWVDHRVRDAEVGEVLWVLPGRHTPCYECHVLHRQGAPDAEAARGARLDIQQIVLATAQVVRALLDPTAETSAILDPGDPARNLPSRTLVYVHGLTPTSPGVRAAFPSHGLFSRNLEIHFPPMPCPACGGQALSAAAPMGRAAATGPPEFDRLSQRERAKRVEHVPADVVRSALNLEIAAIEDQLREPNPDANLRARLADLTSARWVIGMWEAENADWPIPFADYVRQTAAVARNGLVLSNETAVKFLGAESWLDTSYTDNVADAIRRSEAPPAY